MARLKQQQPIDEIASNQGYLEAKIEELISDIRMLRLEVKELTKDVEQLQEDLIRRKSIMNAFCWLVGIITSIFGVALGAIQLSHIK